MPKVKALQCALALEISSVTCPGVVLKDKEDIYLSICVFGQYKKTQCVPATFPLVFNARMVFEKVFPEAVDPGDVVTQLEYDTAVFELIQLVPPVGETLSTYDENTRDFMFPGPNQMSGHHDSNRQVTMRRISGLRGSSPKLEFSTTSVITECLISSRKCRTQDKFIYHLAPVEKSHGRLQNRTSRSQKKKSKSPERSKYCINAKNYEQPTISSKSHSPSPYTKRRMCELSEDTRRRLAHLNLGPYEFKKETDKPPFVIRHVDPPSPRADTLFGSSGRDCERDGWSRVHNDHSHLGCCRPKDYKVIRTPHGRDFDDSLEKCEEYLSPRSCSKPQHSARTLLVHSAPSTMPKHSPSPVLNRASLRERFHSDWCSPSNCDEIHDRDERDQRDLEKDDELELKRSLLYRDSAYDSDPEYSSCQQPRGTFHLDDGEYWSNRAASYKGKSHRPIFENSMDKMYRNLYKKACSSASHTQESF
ncbi:spermatogenesis-associated protein 6 isoform X2 [Macaca nemestrina]|uniref:Spermatosis associated 6 n=1 Tax=Chlorocebus sabaeus TaxID=60711 RepID=A0A0D9S7C1_CHLSB|nr:spermatogenesis-associated protein 6 isoform X2 [Papio anubis]XP_005543485.1 spermatogenesis-associated protein 6 isoform X2 [Macaca fascicularis]XP_007977015.1 spermatogenesis-associated protein 6 isoform X2 [Chlorocebus sabaeus]XP_011762443.1 spermatogenesis-associated protein 6 isoform X2 [Macaca nemestrina]XP_011884961.1 PREDICTED: spermatogenesis-associated protein 6 isoform X2 [Cercocebus atys]XP_014994530.1 spermatogenesis-associated protein 6 isoform X1 [Macaca mulatta]XP_030798794